MSNQPNILPFSLGETSYKYFADNRLRVALKGDLETGIIVETQKQQNKRAIQYLELYEIAAAVANVNGISEEEAFDWVNAVASDPQRISELGDYAGRIRSILEKAPISEEIEAEETSIFMRYRAEYKTDNGKWRSLNEWSKQHHGRAWDVSLQLQLPASLNHEIYEVISSEKESEASEETEQSVPLADAPNGSTNKSKTPQTGAKSSGESS